MCTGKNKHGHTDSTTATLHACTYVAMHVPATISYALYKHTRVLNAVLQSADLLQCTIASFPMLLCTLFEFNVHGEAACILNVCPSIYHSYRQL